MNTRTWPTLFENAALLVCGSLLFAGCHSRKPAANRTVEQLLDDLAHSSTTTERVAAVKGLKRQITPRVTEGLAAALDDPAPEVRNQALVALKNSADPGTNDALLAVAQDGTRAQSLRVAAASALAYRHDLRAADPLIQALPYANSAATAGLMELGDAAAQPLADALRRGVSRDEASKVLVSIGHGAVDPLIALLGDDNKYVRLATVKTLSEIDDARAVRALENFLRSANSEYFAAAYRFLIRRGQPGSEIQLISALHDYGMVAMAEDFVSSGNANLKAAAAKWASDRGLVMEQRTSDLPPAHWAASPN